MRQPRMEPVAPNRLPTWLAGELRRQEWTQTDLARKLGVRTGTVHRWLHGTRPDPAYCELLADALGRDVDTILALAGHRAASPPTNEDRARLIDKLNRLKLSPDQLLAVEGLLDGLLAAQRAFPAASADGRTPSPARVRRSGR